MFDPVVLSLVGAAVVVIVFSLLSGWWRRRRESAVYARRREELRSRQKQQEMHEKELERLAGRILATSSTGEIPGFAVLRQIEAVYTDDHPSPGRAVEVLKAVAAAKGANALINLKTGRALNAKCQANADAVLVRVLEDAGGGSPGAARPADSPETP